MTVLHRTEQERTKVAQRVTIGWWFFGATFLTIACSIDDPVTADAHSPLGGPGATRVLFSDYGKLSGGMAGHAWIASGRAAVIDAPDPCGDQGCFQDVQRGLCTRGSLPALTCQSPESWDCNYGENWGVMVGLNPQANGGAWGPAAPQTVAVAYSGGPGNYRLTAHVAGDPPGRAYCLEGYASGMPVEAGQLKTECWSSDGQPLASFAVIDNLGLLLTSTKSPTSFDYCVSGVALDLRANPGRVVISDQGKLSGPLAGYAWVAGGETTTFASPSPCNSGGCFRNTGGKLCARGTIEARTCTVEGTGGETCDDASSWGAMIGMNPTADRQPWGAWATRSVSFVYTGSPGSYRLTAHVAGDPDGRSYCIPSYAPGRVVTAEMFRSECWREGGAQLASFVEVDSFGLLLTPANTKIDFDYCVSAIAAR
ncbi:MAG: hypothetical protein JW751_18450 [Polyangiaceae bacterium]|nr:hypothetical protein [Polyangiaceae bacterium]